MSVITLGIPGVILLLILGKKIPGPEYVRWILTAGWPIYAFLAWWLIAHRQGRIAFGGICALVVLVNCLAYAHRTAFLDRYADDSLFLCKVREEVQADQPIWVLVDNNPLDASWRLFYLGPQPALHNATFLRSDRFEEPTVYIVCRKSDEKSLQEYGTVEQLDQSRKSRGEESPADRFTLYRLRSHPHLERVPGNVRITPMQATGRKRGPYLKPIRHTASLERRSVPNDGQAGRLSYVACYS